MIRFFLGGGRSENCLNGEWVVAVMMIIIIIIIAIAIKFFLIIDLLYVVLIVFCLSSISVSALFLVFNPMV